MTTHPSPAGDIARPYEPTPDEAAADAALVDAIAREVVECGKSATAELLRGLAHGLETADGH